MNFSDWVATVTTNSVSEMTGFSCFDYFLFVLSKKTIKMNSLDHKIEVLNSIFLHNK